MWLRSQTTSNDAYAHYIIIFRCFDTNLSVVFVKSHVDSFRVTKIGKHLRWTKRRSFVYYQTSCRHSTTAAAAAATAANYGVSEIGIKSMLICFYLFLFMWFALDSCLINSAYPDISQNRRRCITQNEHHGNQGRNAMVRSLDTHSTRTAGQRLQTIE